MKTRLLRPSFYTAWVCFALTPNTVEAQCINLSQYPLGITTLDQTTTLPITISGCTYTTEYSVIQVNSLGVYTFTVDATPGYVTLTDALNNVIAHGPSPFQASILGMGQYRAHWTDDAACGSTLNCYTTTAVFTSSLSGCIPPLGITATGFTATSANISWTASTSNPANGYEYVVTTTAGTPTGSGTATTATSFAATTLAPNTQYFVYVRAMCANDTSLWNFTSFFTACSSVVTVPWTEDFEGPAFALNHTFDPCWITIPASGFGYSWWLETDNTPSPNTGPSADHTTGVPGAGQYIYTEANSGSAGDQAGIWTPLIDISGITNPALRFWKHFHGWGIDSFLVEIDTGSGFQTIYATQSDGPQTAGTDPWVEEEVDLNPFAGSTALQIRFRAIRGGLLGDLALDDISVDVGPPCPKPSAISVISVGTTDVTLDWVPSSGTSWEVAYGAPGFHPDAAVGSANGPIGILPASTHPFVVTGLTASTDYHFYVRETCAPWFLGVRSGWRGFTDTRTNCMAVAAPWAEDFEGPTFALYFTFDPCWTTIPASLYATPGWVLGTNCEKYAYATGPCADHTTGVPGIGRYIYTVMVSHQVIILTPLIDISGLTNPELRFWKHSHGAHIDSFFAEVDTGSGFQTIYATQGPGPQTAHADPWSEEVLSLNAFAGSTGLQIRFRATSSGPLSQLALDDISVDTGPCFLNASVAAISASCFGTNNGTAAVTASGGTPPYSYLWNTGDVTPALSNLTAGPYQVTVTDAGGCTAGITTTVTQNTAISAIMVQDNVNCFGGSNGWASLNVSGGTPPYSYLWNTGGLTSTLSNLTAGLYQITVTDAHGCTIDNQVNITEPAELVVMVDIVPPDEAVANVTGGSPPYTYVWSTVPPQTTQTATGLSPGTYTVTITDANGCSATWDFMIGMEEPGFAQYIDLYPNPSTDEVFINYNFTGEMDLEVTVMNHLAQVVLTISEPNAVSGQLRLEVAEWAGGIYNVLFSNGSQSSNRQLVIQK